VSLFRVDKKLRIVLVFPTPGSPMIKGCTFSKVNYYSINSNLTDSAVDTNN
jgi:hypothetical protein